MSSEVVQRIRRRLGYLRWRMKTYLHSRVTAKCYDDPQKIYWIDPKLIEWICVYPDEPSPLEQVGTVRSGDWDLRRIPLEQYDQFQAFQMRFQQGRRWQDTPWYASMAKDMQSGVNHFFCSSQEQLDRHFEKVDVLYERIKKEGYLLQSQLNGLGLSEKQRADEVLVHLDRNGRYVFGDGRHRFFIARVLGLEQIPVVVSRRHAQWVKFRMEILDHLARESKGEAYHPLPHPDLSDIRSTHGHERFEIMRTHLESQRGTLLDIGAHWGYWSHRCEELGCQCTAVESFPREAYFLRRLRDSMGRKFTIIEKSVLDLTGPQRFDVVLALNIFHHFLKQEASFKKLVDLLGRIDTKMILFQPHLKTELPMQKAYRNFDQEEFASFVAEHARMSRIEKCGTAPDGRNIFVIRK